jgi:hypothetical protein
MSKLTVFVNGQPVFDYDRDTELAEEQLAFLDKMDGDMSRGIKINGKLIQEPDRQQRAQFVAMNLIKALTQDNEAAISVSSAYLAHRFPELSEVHARDMATGIDIELRQE